MTGSRVFVTGATGFIGARLVAALEAAGAEVHALSRSAPAEPGITWHRGDLLDPASLRASLSAARPSVVFHLAAYGARPGERDRQRMLDVNVRGSMSLWTVLPDSVARVVAAGTCREYAPANGPVDEQYPCAPARMYPATKHAMTVLLSALAAEDRRQLVLLRPFGPYGPKDESDRVIPFTIARLLRGETVPLSSGQQLCDFAYVDDHVEAFVRAATAPLAQDVSVFNIGSGDARTLRSVVEAVADAVGGDARARLRFGAHPDREGDSPALCADISAARRHLGYTPRISLSEGLERTVAWFRSRLPHQVA